MSEFISTTQAGKILKLTRQSIARLIHNGELNATRPPNAGKTTGYKIDATDVYALLQKRNAPKTEKRCPRCEQTKPFIEFTRCRSRKDGYAAYCRQCRKELYKENQEHILAQKKEYGRKNKKAIRERGRKYYAQRKDEINANRREQYIENKADILAARRNRYATDAEYREKRKRQAKQYRKENPKKVKTAQKEYYAQNKDWLNKQSRIYAKDHRKEISEQKHKR